MSLIIGLTGGIACGKSTVSQFFKAHHVPVIDCDEIARQLMKQGKPCYEETLAHFGQRIMQADGSLNRSALRTLIFTDPKAKAWLEGLLHPLIADEVSRAIAEIKLAQPAYIVVDIPLLLEYPSLIKVDRILVVDTPTELQYQRLQERDKHTEDFITRILSNQVSRTLRLELATDLIENDADLTTLANQVGDIDKLYRRLSS